MKKSLLKYEWRTGQNGTKIRGGKVDNPDRY